MRITADTNLLVRLVVKDDARQRELVINELARAEAVAVPISVLCEVVWVLRSAYKIPRPSIAGFMHELLNIDKLYYDELAVDHGLAVLEAGGDFSDGVIAFSGLCMGAEEFVTFDKKAAKLVAQAGMKARLLGA